jgi:hypothetical protein
MVCKYNVILFCLWKGNPAICDNMGGPGRYYIKWNKPDTEGQTLHDTS